MMTNQPSQAPLADFEVYCPVRLVYARGAIERLDALADDATSVLIVTGQSSARAGGLLQRLARALGQRRVSVFEGVEPNPSIETVERGAKAATEAAADLVIGVGGGSAMDAAKAIAAVAPNGGKFRPLLGRQSYRRPPLRLMLVPTTCGTGSEANHYSIITDTQANDKLNFSSRYTYPEVAILDPSVLDALPRQWVIWTALDAFTHAMEGYTSRRSQPFTDVLALEAIGVILRSLHAAADGDADARGRLLYASAVAGIVIAHAGTTMLHAMGYHLTLRHGVPHGCANATLVPLLLEHIQRFIPDKVANVLALLPGRPATIDGFVDYLHSLGVATTLSAAGVQAEEFDYFADYVLGKKNTAATAGSIDKPGLVALFKRFA
jgi:alcohol dehydrogenase class IV